MHPSSFHCYSVRPSAAPCRELCPTPGCLPHYIPNVDANRGVGWRHLGQHRAQGQVQTASYVRGCCTKVPAGCSSPQRNILAWQGGSTLGKGTEELQKALGNALQSYECKTTLLGASSSGWGLGCARLSWHLYPAGTQQACARGVPGVSTSLWMQRVHLGSCACSGTVCPAVPAADTAAHAWLCGCTCTVLAPRQPCLPVPVLTARAKPRCACMLGLEPQGASVPAAIHSLGMLKLASRRLVCFLYLPVTGRALGASLQFV